VPKHGIAVANIESGIEVSMKFKATPRTSELMTGALTLKPAPGAYLRGICRVNQGYLPLTFNLISGKGKEHSPWPSMKPSIPGTATSFALTEIEGFEDQGAVLGCPLYQPFRGNMAEVLSAAGLLALQMFEGPSDGLGALTLYLTGLKPLLKPLYCLTTSLVPDPSFKTADKKFLTIGVNGNHGVSLIEVYANRKDTGCIWDFNSESDIANKLTIPDLHCDAVNPFGISQHRFEIIGNGIAKALPAGYRPDRKGAILLEVGIPPPFANKKQGKGAFEPDRSPELVPVAFGSNIGPGNEPDSSTGKLTGELALDRVISSFVKGKGFKRLTTVPANWRNPVGNISKCLKGCLEVGIRLYNYLSSALAVHQRHATTILNKCQVFSGRRFGGFLCQLKQAVPAA